MKKIYILLVLICFLSAAHAQRVVDLQTTLKSPLAGATVTSGQLFQIHGVIRNLSATPLTASDTIMVAITMDGGPLFFVVNGQPVSEFPVTGATLNQNDSLEYNWSNNLFFPANVNGPHQLCLVATATNRGNDPLTDNVPANNEGCAAVTFAGGGFPSSVSGVAVSNGSSQVIRIFPVPATDQVSLELQLADAGPVTVRILDLSGRAVLAADQGVLAKGGHTVQLPAGDLAAGTYLYQVVMEDAVSTGRLLIVR